MLDAGRNKPERCRPQERWKETERKTLKVSHSQTSALSQLMQFRGQSTLNALSETDEAPKPHVNS